MNIFEQARANREAQIAAQSAGQAGPPAFGTPPVPQGAGGPAPMSQAAFSGYGPQTSEQAQRQQAAQLIMMLKQKQAQQAAMQAQAQPAGQPPQAPPMNPQGGLPPGSPLLGGQ